MARSKRDPKRESNLVNYKNKQKQKKRTMATNQQQSAPQVQPVPTWNAGDTIIVNGKEWELIADFITGAERAIMAFHSVMQRNVQSGTIKMEFQQLNADGSVTELSADEQKPYQEEFQSMLKQATEVAEKVVAERDLSNQEGLPHLDGIVDSHGDPIDSESVGKIITM